MATPTTSAKTKKGSKIAWYAVLGLILWYAIPWLNSIPAEMRASEKRQEEAQRQEAIEDAAWEKERLQAFTLKPGEKRMVKTQFRMWEFDNIYGPVKAAAFISGTQSTDWVEFHPNRNTYLTSPSKAGSIVIWNDGRNAVNIIFKFHERYP